MGYSSRGKLLTVQGIWKMKFMALFLLLMGCAGDRVDGGSAPVSLDQLAQKAYEAGFDWQGDILSDGDVTRVEYDEAHRRNLECLASNGMTASEAVRDRLDGYRWRYSINYADALSEIENIQAILDCSQETIMFVEMAMEHWGDWETDPAVMRLTEECIAENGFSANRQFQNYRDLQNHFRQDGITDDDISECISGAMDQLYPEESYAYGGMD